MSKHTYIFSNFHGRIKQISKCPSCECNAWEFKIEDTGFRDYLESNRYIHQVCVGITSGLDSESMKHYGESFEPRLLKYKDNKDYKKFFEFIYRNDKFILYITETIKVKEHGWITIEHPGFEEEVDRDHRFNPPETLEEVLEDKVTTCSKGSL
jgi:hypothetical protein